jgi:hypothetical protein
VLQTYCYAPVPPRFLFPPDLCLDMATWAEEKVEDASRAQEKFNIEPREGTIKPGDTMSLTFSFRSVLSCAVGGPGEGCEPQMVERRCHQISSNLLKPPAVSRSVIVHLSQTW